MEYCGELINKKEMDKRLNNDYKSQKNWFLFEVESDNLYIYFYLLYY